MKLAILRRSPRSSSPTRTSARRHIILALLLTARALIAGEQTTDSCMAPDFKHEVVLRGDQTSEVAGYEFLIWARNDGQSLYSKGVGGYASFSAATSPANFKCLWSPDSKLVAVYIRDTKRSGDTTIYSVIGEKVTAIAVPDLTSRIRPHLTAAMRSSWIHPEVWLPDHVLILSVEGTQLDEEHANFRFILTLHLLGKKGKISPKITSFRQDRSIDLSVK